MAVAFILSPDNVNFLSWGTKKIKLPGTNIVFPAITRRRSSTVMFEQYLACAPSEVLLSKKTFSRFVTALTANGAVLRKSVDYVVGLLINDSFDKLKTIVSRLNLTSTRISDDMELVKSYLKYGFDQRVKSTTAQHCLLHNIKFGLSTPDDAATPLPRVICDNCKAVFYFFARFKDILALREVHPTTLKLVGDCSEMARLFLGHRIRTINQQLAIQRLVDQMRDQCMQSKGTQEANVTLDFKMKLEPIYFREKTVDHYGKRGISWHGALVHYFEFNDGDSTGDQNPVNDMKVYYDHISKSDTKQDREAVVSILEAILIRLRKDMPSIKKISLLTDNATCYQNWLLPLVAPYLSRLHGITVSRIIHTETQDGKSVLDAHFARSTHHVIDWVKEGNNCITPTQLVIGLQSRGGMKNCISELVDHHRQRLTDLTRQVAPMEKRCAKLCCAPTRSLFRMVFLMKTCV